ncbi:hypothetical protein [Amycolatopsis sp. cmx-4-61]|uniref:hypothetical protein n=1 Tax=Amycolatopsis sp. cmx-4-61 TaxID=2790937 RepID=UPI0039796C45
MANEHQAAISQSGNGQMNISGTVAAGTGSIAISAARQASLSEALSQLRHQVDTADSLPMSIRSEAGRELEALDDELAGRQPQPARIVGGVKRLTEILAAFSGFTTNLQHLHDSVSHIF